MNTNGSALPREFALIIGAMKSGTTSLFHVLSQHPQIAAASVKEPKFFSEDDVWNRGWEWYLGLWSWDAARHRIALEASTAYTTFPARPETPSRIASIKDASFRFVYIMRHPARQIESNIRHTLYVGWGQSLDDGIPPWMIDTVRYAMQLDRYVAKFPRESLLLLTLEQFQQEPQVVLQQVCRFLGVSDTFEFRRADERYNAGEAYEIPGWLARILRDGSLSRWLVARTPRSLRYRIRALLPRVARQEGALGRHKMTDAEQFALLEELAPDLRRLQDTYGVDVTRWWGGEKRALGT